MLDRFLLSPHCFLWGYIFIAVLWYFIKYDYYKDAIKSPLVVVFTFTPFIFDVIFAIFYVTIQYFLENLKKKEK
jgi:hypothetical protein